MWRGTPEPELHSWACQSGPLLDHSITLVLCGGLSWAQLDLPPSPGLSFFPPQIKMCETCQNTEHNKSASKKTRPIKVESPWEVLGLDVYGTLSGYLKCLLPAWISGLYLWWGALLHPPIFGVSVSLCVSTLPGWVSSLWCSLYALYGFPQGCRPLLHEIF